MGIPSGGSVDKAHYVAADTFGDTGEGAWLEAVSGRLVNISLWGTFSATVTLERSFDGGTTAVPVSSDTIGTASSYTAPASIQIRDDEPGVVYRLNCTAYVSGTVSWRISQ